MKSLTQRMSGAGALNWRFTLSSGHGRALSGIVVLAFLPRSLLSTAMLNNARSRALPAISRRTRMDQTCLGMSGRFWPMMRPLFQGTRTGHRAGMARGFRSGSIFREFSRLTPAIELCCRARTFASDARACAAIVGRSANTPSTAQATHKPAATSTPIIHLRPLPHTSLC